MEFHWITGLWALRWNGPKLERVPARALNTYRRYIETPPEESVGASAAPLAPVEPPVDATVAG